VTLHEQAAYDGINAPWCDLGSGARLGGDGSHTVYALHYHFVFIPKYRKPALRGDGGIEVRDLIGRSVGVRISRFCMRALTQ
jgi:hypothetical protein